MTKTLSGTIGYSDGILKGTFRDSDGKQYPVGGVLSPVIQDWDSNSATVTYEALYEISGVQALAPGGYVGTQDFYLIQQNGVTIKGPLSTGVSIQMTVNGGTVTWGASKEDE